MNVNLLIDAIVRQTMVLTAQLATQAGARAPLAHVANQVFLDLVGELTNQGLGRKVIADMFGVLAPHLSRPRAATLRVRHRPWSIALGGSALLPARA